VTVAIDMPLSAKKIFLIGSGKGGVGKSTVAVNLAIALAHEGLSIGLLDADIYGPSIPIMMGLRSLGPRLVQNTTGQQQIIPLAKFGIKVISIGFFLEEARAVLWRGPMLHGILHKMIQEVEWGQIDILLIDLPPGTGDVPLSLSQLLPVDGALIVCTPQEVAIMDAIKAINTLHQLHIPLIGIIENMAGFTVPGTEHTFHLFGEGKAQELARRLNTPLLASIPLIPTICQGGDEGYPAAFHQGNENVGAHFRQLAHNFIASFQPVA
jgi:ATP-binding protein involved in chromosome partitioning